MFILTILNQSLILWIFFRSLDVKSKWRVARCKCEEILPCFQDNNTYKQPRRAWGKLKIISIPGSRTKFKMAFLLGASARGKLSRLFPCLLHMSGYCHAAAMENYLYHPKSRPLEPEIQTLNLTKTIHMGDISSCLQNTVIDAATRESMMPKFRQNIIQTRLINFDGEIATRDMCALPLMQNMLRVVWSSTNRWEIEHKVNSFTLVPKSLL